MRAFPLPGDGRLVHLNNVSGGVLAGDRLALDVKVDRGARAQITTTGATRLYRHRCNASDSTQHTTVLVGDGAQLDYLPDAIIPYAGSRHDQRTEIRLGRGAGLFWWEVLAPGRLAAGERFAFERLGIHTAILTDDRPLLREDYVLEPVRRALASPVRMLGYSHMVSFCAIREGKPVEFWRKLEERLNQIASAKSSPPNTVWGASALVSDGILVRGLANSGRFVYPSLVEFWHEAHLAITGSNAVLPRKIY